MATQSVPKCRLFPGFPRLFRPLSNNPVVVVFDSFRKSLVLPMALGCVPAHLHQFVNPVLLFPWLAVRFTLLTWKWFAPFPLGFRPSNTPALAVFCFPASALLLGQLLLQKSTQSCGDLDLPEFELQTESKSSGCGIRCLSTMQREPKHTQCAKHGS